MKPELPSTLIAGLLLITVALNLRPALTAIGPLMEEIRVATGMGYPLGSLLAVLPVFAMGAIALLASQWERRLGAGGCVSVGLLCIGLACMVRLLTPQPWLLISSAALAGCGIGLIQVVAPGLIKRQFISWVPLAMGIYTAAMMGGGGLAAWLSPWLVERSDQWQLGLGMWLLPVVLAWLMWLPARRYLSSVPAPVAPRSFFRNRRARQLAIYFGLSNCGYISMVAWLPTYYRELGVTPVRGGELLVIMTLFQVVATLLLPSLAQVVTGRRGLLVGSLLAQLLGFCGLAWWPLTHAGFWSGLIGFGLGACFVMGLILSLDHIDDPQQAGQLTAFVQGVGFIITGFSPWVAGWLRALNGDFQLAWVAMVGILGVMLLQTRRFSRASYAQIT